MFKQQEETRKLIARFKAKQELQFIQSIQIFNNLGLIEESLTSHNKSKCLNSSSQERTSAEVELIPQEVESFFMNNLNIYKNFIHLSHSPS